MNLHFTGDFHAITSAHNLLAAMIDNHLHWGNALDIDPRRISWRRVLDMNARALRGLVLGLGGPAHGVPRESGFDITVASEVMAILCLATDLRDLQARLARIEIARRRDGLPVTAGDLGADGAMTVLLKDAMQPNLVQTIEGTPARFAMLISMMRERRVRPAYSSRYTAAPTPTGTASAAVSAIT